MRYFVDRSLNCFLLALSFSPLCLGQASSTNSEHAKQPFTFQEVMVPMRDGVRLQTVILTPAGQSKPLPILLQRTPYGIPEKSLDAVPDSWKELMTDGYVFVAQNLRGRFKSEGTFHLSSSVDLTDVKATNETTDAYDTIDWLVKNVPNNNGRVGIWGVSYLGLTAGMTLLHPHPALKAVSEQASPVDQWMNDDMHRFGALRLSYAFEYSVMEQSDKNANTHFSFDTYDTYQWYLNVGPLSNLNSKYLHGSIPFWTETVEHPNYDEFWRREAWVRQLHGSPVPNLNVAGFWDQEDPWGPWQIFRHSEENDPGAQNFIVAGPWFHGEWQHSKADKIGEISFGGHDTAREFRETIEAPFFRYYLHGSGDKFTWKASTFQSGSNTWHKYQQWPPKESRATNLYLHADGTLSFDPPQPGEKTYAAYVSDPANPVPYRQRPISPTYPRGDWTSWEVADQRFVDHRPDVSSFISAPLEHDLAVTGELSADLFASTSGTDSDFVIKLIDVYPENAAPNPWSPGEGPEPGEFMRSLNGYELPIAMEVRRGRFNKSYEHPQALIPNQPTEFVVPLRDHDHVFRKGHRLMVQVQSTWFPLIDRNPQTFTPSIYTAKATDFVTGQSASVLHGETTIPPGPADSAIRVARCGGECGYSPPSTGSEESASESDVVRLDRTERSSLSRLPASSGRSPTLPARRSPPESGVLFKSRIIDFFDSIRVRLSMAKWLHSKIPIMRREEVSTLFLLAQTLEIEDASTPEVSGDTALVRFRAAGLHASDLMNIKNLYRRRLHLLGFNLLLVNTLETSPIYREQVLIP